MTSRLPAAAAASLLTLLLLAGCASPDAKTDGGLSTGKTEQTILDPPGKGGEVAGSSQSVAGGKAEAAAGNGEIRGVVQDDAGLAVAEALVSRIGSEASATTDVDGAFRFTNVSAGTHLLRVTASEVYRVHEGEVTVVQDRVTLVTITLVPVDGRGPGYRPHLHDYWGDREELVLLEEPIDWADSPGCGTDYTKYGPAGTVITGGYQPNNSNWWRCFSIPESGDTPPIVLPGTKQLRFSATWGDDVDVDRFVFGYHSPAMQAGSFQVIDDAVGQGEETTLDVTPEMADNGHQLFSLWGMRIKPEPRTQPMTILGPIHVKIVMVKGELPVDPPHEDFWGGNTSLLVRAWDPPKSGVTLCCSDFHMMLPPDANLIVPPGTLALRMRFSVVLGQASGTPADGEWDLLAKPANLAPGTPLEDYRVLEPEGTSGGVQTYLLRLDPSETDAFYQKQSNWMFAARATTDLAEGMQETQHHFRLEAIAEKDPAFV
jgi:hypothetical protein